MTRHPGNVPSVKRQLMGGFGHGRDVPGDDSHLPHLQRGEGQGEFYVDYLGFSLDWEHHVEDNTPAYIQVSRSGLVLHLSENHGDCCPGSTAVVRMTDIGEFHQELSAKNYKYLRPAIETTPFDTKCLEVIDPFGNRIRFNESHKSAAAM